jgi:hypothetical protein
LHNFPDPIDCQRESEERSGLRNLHDAVPSAEQSFCDGFEFKHDPDVADSDGTPNRLVEHNWLVGSPSTARQRLANMAGKARVFGTLFVSEEPEAWAASQRMLIDEVLPHFQEKAAA